GATLGQGGGQHPLVGQEAIDPLGLSPAARGLRDGIARPLRERFQDAGKRAGSRLSGKTVPAATRAAQSVCVCIARPPRGIKACCPLLLSYYPLLVLGPLPQRMEVVGNGQGSSKG